MQNILFLTIFSTMIVFYACKKDESINSTTIDKKNSKIYDTIKPLSYFPAYPGSYWVYNTNDTLKVANQYIKHAFNKKYTCSFCDPVYENYYVPKLEKNNIWGYSYYPIYVKGYFLNDRYILTEQEGDIFYITNYYAGNQIVGINVKKDTSITVNGNIYNNVIMTTQLDWFSSCGISDADSCSFTREYYAKDVGLIKREEGGINNHHIWTTTLELTDYKINK